MRMGIVSKGAKIAHSSSVISPRITVGLEFTRRPVKIDLQVGHRIPDAKKQRNEPGGRELRFFSNPPLITWILCCSGE